MKNLAVLALVIFGLTSCSKDSFDVSFENLQAPEKSEIMVRVSYIDWSDEQCESSCGIGSEEVAFIPNADVSLFYADNNQSDTSNPPMFNLRTDQDGVAVLRDIDPGTYRVTVDTEFGKKSRTLTTQLNKRSYIDFSF